MKICDPEFCEDCQYIGEGAFICDKYSMPLVVIDGWEATDNYLVCMKERKPDGRLN